MAEVMNRAARHASGKETRRCAMSRVFAHFLIALLAAGMLWCADAVAHDNVIRLVVYGDSLMSGYQLQAEEGFPGQLNQKLRANGFKNVEVINMSLAGETTTGGVERLTSLLQKQPDIVILELGSNDILRGLSLGFVSGNLRSLNSTLAQNGVYVIVVGVKALPSMSDAYISQLEAIYRGVAGKGSFYPDILQGITGHPQLTLADGFQPNAAGVRVMVEGMYPLVYSAVRWKWETLSSEQRYRTQHPGVTQSIVPVDADNPVPSADSQALPVPPPPPPLQ
jgi:acyl-CoA thioesterase I